MQSRFSSSQPDGYASPADADFRRLFNLSLDLLCIAGIDGYFKQVNPSWTRVLGWSEAELLSRPVADFMHPDDRGRTLEARAQLARGKPVRGLENRYVCKDGSYRWLSWQSSIEPTATTVFAVARDITERRQLDGEMLIASKLESAGILAGGIAHDFNNLLAGLLLNLEMVGACGPTNAEQATYLRSSSDMIIAAKTLTNQLVTAAHGATSTRELTDMTAFLSSTLKLALADRSVRVTSEVASELWPAQIDGTQIEQAIRNVVVNACEATPPDGSIYFAASNVTLDGEEGMALKAGHYLRLTISDRGKGISAEQLCKVFDPYFSTKRRGIQKGMGLGLTVCRAILQDHGGTIAITSEVAGGTVVTCYLPAEPRDALSMALPPDC